MAIPTWGQTIQQDLRCAVHAADPWTIALAPLALLACGILAAMIPARRAAAINPIEALRAE